MISAINYLMGSIRKHKRNMDVAFEFVRVTEYGFDHVSCRGNWWNIAHNRKWRISADNITINFGDLKDWHDVSHYFPDKRK